MMARGRGLSPSAATGARPVEHKERVLGTSMADQRTSSSEAGHLGDERAIRREARRVASLPVIALSAGLALASAACTGLETGISYPGDLPDPDASLLSPEGESDPSITLGAFKISNALCKDIDTHPITNPLTQDDFTRFLESQGVKIAPKKARSNLYWYDFPNGEDAPNDYVRLRLAVLDSSTGAGKDLHDSLLEHGPGWWGVRRANLAVLAPKAGLGEALAFAIKYKLPCWGMFTTTGVDDAYVVPGPYVDL
jgi:hypothetical protein